MRRPGRNLLVFLAGAALLGGAAVTPAQAQTAQTEARTAKGAAARHHAADDHLTDLVNPFIGSENDGNTYPGAAVPFGMVQLSPDTGHTTGYSYSDSRIRGFSSVHISGVGCGLGGDLPVLPTTGDVTETDYSKYAAEYDHDDEEAHPGYYRVGLKSYGGIGAELSATTRTAAQRYTFPATDKANVMLNAGQALHKNASTGVEVLDSRTIRTAITGKGFCQDTKPYTVYTITRFDRPFTSFGTWNGAKVTAGSKSSTSTGRNGAYARFDTREDRTVEATTAISYVDAAGAAGNLRAEGGHSFSAVKDAADRAWEKRLELVEAQGGDTTLRRTFYSSLYRSFLAPNIGSDADGRYKGWDQKAHSAKGFDYYQNWSLWDTYRTQTQLLSLLAPRESRDMALSVLRIDKEGGWLPKWGYGTVETNIMTGDPVTPFLTNAYQQGLLKGHEEEAYAALKKNADGVPPTASPAVGREANTQYLKDGYAPYIKGRTHAKPGDSDFDHGASATLEYALSDAMLAQMARDLGHDEDADRYAGRAQNYRKIFDPTTGFFRARDDKGAFAGPADPAQSEGFHEGTSWQYQWMVPQDLNGMIGLIGGKTAAEQRLDSFFAYDQLLQDPVKTARDVWVNGPYDYYNADKYNPQNEPDLIAPYTYLSTGSPWKTTDVVHSALTLFTDTPTGMTGNDDLGTMSAWMVLSSIGVFPVQPGTDSWGLSTPVFDRVDLKLDRGYYPEGRFTISAEGTSATHRYVRSARLDHRDQSHTYLTTDDIRSGRNLTFTVGEKPSTWGTGTGDAPPPVGVARK
ncbi:GH92 family glycosyl hydrolase [Streptomyces tsukubensis]|uniref:Alpha-1,2-mannosidase n=2 Tax=Streptomyces tsukubensis TaxID=83656 RepID=A0A1V4A192_9ACTN|nr:GH92 family glycosyl hydrolase [Streptomyces tsukubensis]OON72505.1 alpha-1,2-mannosidase [Streptomyces tsukubensis]QFR97677.1 glycoside hydrolase family 92 protein [Streptomyces tsukubensis]